MKTITVLLLLLLSSCGIHPEDIEVEQHDWYLVRIENRGDPYHCCTIIWRDDRWIYYSLLATEYDTAGKRIGMHIINLDRR